MSEALTEKPNEDAPARSTGASIIINGHYAPPPEDKDGKLWVSTSANVQASPEDLYALWRNVENAPLWQEEIERVEVLGPTTSRWTMRSGKSDAQTLTWDSEVLADEPGSRIAWRSIAGESNNAGEVIFEAAPGGSGTIVIVLQEFRMGKLASAWETLFGRNPKQAVIENLRHFKALAETGEIPRSQNAPHGSRGLIGGMKRSLYGEKVPTPPGANAA
ncbi:MAG TPA: SRPBCC family protein [Terracidiphilus sp.]|nr:SRPBCC family protein [Terracidiphilus sp.]